MENRLIDFFGDRPNLMAHYITSYMTLHTLDIYRFVHLEEFPVPFIWSDLCEIVTIEAFRNRLLFKRIIAVYFPYLITMESYDRFMKRFFARLYNTYYKQFSPHMAFIRLCSFAMELIVYLMNRQFSPVLCRNTTFLLARILSGREFARESSFFKMDELAKERLQDKSSYEAVRSKIRKESLNETKVTTYMRNRQFENLFLGGLKLFGQGADIEDSDDDSR